MTGRVIYYGTFLNNKVTGTEKRRFWLIYLKTFQKFTFLGPVTSILTSFMKFCVAQTSRTRSFSPT